MASITLQKEVLKKLEECRLALGVRQAHIAKIADVGQGTVSNFMRGKAIRPQVVAQILRAFNILVLNSQSSQKITAEKAQDFLRTISGVQHPQVKNRSYPGGGMPPGASNQVVRQGLWCSIRDLSFHPCFKMVVGPPRSGKTTLISRLGHEARQVGFGVVYFDCQLCLGFSTQQVLKELAECIAMECGFKVVSPNSSMRTAEFYRWLNHNRQVTSHPPLLVIVDEVNQLSEGVIVDVVRLVSILQNIRGCTNTSFILSGHSLPQEVGSELVNVGDFTEDDVRELLTCYGLEDVDTLLTHLREQYGGFPPYETHLAVEKAAATVK